jgi:type I restriction enzyme S subunit
MTDNLSSVEKVDHSIVSFNILDGRLDAGHYANENIICLRDLSSLQGVTKLSNLAKTCSGPFGSSLHSASYLTYPGIPFIRPSNIKDLFIEGDLVYISKNDHQKLRGSQLGDGDIVLYKIGAGLGTIGIISPELGEVNISENMIGIRPRDKVMSSYLAIFLVSRYGQLQIDRQKSNQARPKINVADINEIIVPQPNEKLLNRINSLVNLIYKNRMDALSQYKKAERLLYETLSIEKEESETEKIYIVDNKIIEADRERRLDTQHNDPRYLFFIHKLVSAEQDTNIRVIPLAQIGKLTRGIEVGSNAYTKDDCRFMFVRVANLTEKGIRKTNSDVYIRSSLYNKLRDDLKPEPGDVLVSKDGSLGLSVVIQEDFQEFIYSSGIVKISQTDVNPYYLSLFLNSRIFRGEAEREAIGSIIKHLSLEKLSNLKIPLVPNQGKIGSLVQASLGRIRESQRLIQEAKSIVEEYIRKQVQYASATEQ